MTKEPVIGDYTQNFYYATPDIKIIETDVSIPSQMKYRHQHSEYEIEYLSEGSRYYFVDKHVYHADGGSLIFIPKYKFHKTSSLDSKYTRTLFYVNEKYLDKWLLQTSDSKPTVRKYA